MIPGVILWRRYKQAGDADAKYSHLVSRASLLQYLYNLKGTNRTVDPGIDRGGDCVFDIFG